jgi:hypothetical protein
LITTDGLAHSQTLPGMFLFLCDDHDGKSIF